MPGVMDIVLFYVFVLQLLNWSMYVPGLYMIGYGKGKNYFEIPAFLQIERGKSRAGKFKTSNENKKFLFLFSFDFEFEFPALEVPRS